MVCLPILVCTNLLLSLCYFSHFLNLQQAVLFSIFWNYLSRHIHSRLQINFRQAVCANGLIIASHALNMKV